MFFKIIDYVKENQSVADFEYELMALYYGKSAAKITFNGKLTQKERESHLQHLKQKMMKDNGLYQAYLEDYIAFQRNKANTLRWHTEDPKVLMYRSYCASAEYNAFQALCEGRPVEDVVVVQEQLVLPY
ncbi:hypothetical protein GUITHDRAFT_145994 [Guillardia theta CCMP2712]|uniref:Uncharacterized protein n=1 Tax=Guillardia theta (strain CCMP2712) TaxID=905079 RepID=L1IG94_GUITC|nr:hypothetical protein GUITHDRAFT_146946 [Guillardia theta CCMP2712]XP_005823163.1 hypothetical protein GUITHDRAFT_145994 [Guillardia theta CCMP2712]EKX34840.1 hypothetical protein GUITHDRAFT_146946 [Guillardia theta CCMP2712]EKX36183.1 hypothetical protein GUITHDRAFT_145994 [Guillardia theta CCMP2712]|eukprot:XP_005821820.1 hypothetical protein GUITHDRAFT_146946 [Guillardia theta CCMP2712]